MPPWEYQEPPAPLHSWCLPGCSRPSVPVPQHDNDTAIPQTPPPSPNSSQACSGQGAGGNQSLWDCSWVMLCL